MGNFLGQYFHAAGIAHLANIGFHATRLFNTTGFQMPRDIAGHWGDNNYSLVPTLAYHCRHCAPSKVIQWPHTCPGPWLFANHADLLRRSLSQVQTPTESRPIVIQFRCSDTYYRHRYGVLDWKFYREVTPFRSHRHHTSSPRVPAVRQLDG